MKKKIPDYPEYLSAEFAQRFGNFQLEIRHDDGLYRHLVFRDPKTTMERFEITTWPRHLYIGGDWPGHVFSRTEDMLQFFRQAGVGQGRINPDYWSEKLVSGTLDSITSYGRCFVEQNIWAEVRDPYRHGAAPKGLAKAVHKELIDSYMDPLCCWNEARDAIDEFEYQGFEFGETWEWHVRAWTSHFLLACHAIVAIIAAYDAAKAVASNG